MPGVAVADRYRLAACGAVEDGEEEGHGAVATIGVEGVEGVVARGGVGCAVPCVVLTYS